VSRASLSRTEHHDTQPMIQHQMDFRDGIIEPEKLRHALGRFATGVTVVTTCCTDGKLEGLTVNSFSSVSLDPPLVLWSLHRQAPSLASFLDSGRFAINVLGIHQRTLSKHFSQPSRHKFDGVAHHRGLGGCPLLPDCIANFECRTETTIDGGDHVILIGRIERVSHREDDPLIFSAGKYCAPALLGEPV
jgi:flavin reductase (DIM6/NTAB) family NADH-FMN oxidoreductase RutF